MKKKRDLSLKILIEIDALPAQGESVEIKITSNGVFRKGTPGSKKKQKIPRVQRLVTTYTPAPNYLSSYEEKELIDQAAWLAVKRLGWLKKTSFYGERKVELFETAQLYLLERTGIHRFDQKKMVNSALNHILRGPRKNATTTT